MTKKEIIGKLAREGKVKEAINNIAKDSNDTDLFDLEQDTYIQLLEKDDDIIEKLYEDGQLMWYVTRILLNNIHSKTSPFYYRYKKNKVNQISMDDYTEKAD